MNSPFFRLCAVGLLTAGLATSRGAETSTADAAAAQAQYEQIYREQQPEKEKFREAFQQAKTDDERTKAAATFHPTLDKYNARFLELARKYPGSTGALYALAQVASETYADQAARSEAFNILGRDYLQSDQVGMVCLALNDDTTPDARAFLRNVLEKNPHRDAQAFACMKLAEGLRSSNAQESEKLYTRAASEYADVILYEQCTVGAFVQGELFERHHLSVGQTAPEIVGKDVDGKEIKLSDYRGKVVVLDFWGRW